MPEETKKTADDYHFFYGGPFSQWASVPMVIDGTKYSSCEQYMMSEKAKLFGDDEMYAKIMASDDPQEQKMKFGRNVKNFNQDIWQQHAREIVYRGNYAKMTQDARCLEALANSRGKMIVEASPYDKIWGIGLGEGDPRILDESQWQGTNWLGEVIMQVRDDLEKEGWFAYFDDRIQEEIEEPEDDFEWNEGLLEKPDDSKYLE